MQNRIQRKITDVLDPVHLEVINESFRHNVPPGSESHFKLVIVSDEFEGMPLIDRHRKVNGILDEELKNGVHALSMQTHTVLEWEKKGGKVNPSPQCLGGEKKT